MAATATAPAPSLAAFAADKLGKDIEAVPLEADTIVKLYDAICDWEWDETVRAALVAQLPADKIATPHDAFCEAHGCETWADDSGERCGCGKCELMDCFTVSHNGAHFSVCRDCIRMEKYQVVDNWSGERLALLPTR